VKGDCCAGEAQERLRKASGEAAESAGGQSGEGSGTNPDSENPDCRQPTYLGRPRLPTVASETAACSFVNLMVACELPSTTHRGSQAASRMAPNPDSKRARHKI
jgi:hypothetical protein